MTQKHHQEEISGPVDTIEAAPLAKDLPQPKRARIQSFKVRENRAQSEISQVPSPRPANPPLSLSQRRRQLSSSQKSSQQAVQGITNKQEKEEWQIQLESARNKPQKLKILSEHIGPPRPYPEKLNVPTPPDPGCSLLRSDQLKPLDLFHRFIPQELFQGIAGHTNQYASENPSEIDFQEEWQDVTIADIRGYIGAVLLTGVQAGGRDLPYYWNQQDNLPDWPVAEYISRNRFQQISRYIKLNEPGDLPDDQ